MQHEVDGDMDFDKLLLIITYYIIIGIIKNIYNICLHRNATEDVSSESYSHNIDII